MANNYKHLPGPYTLGIIIKNEHGAYGQNLDANTNYYVESFATVWFGMWHPTEQESATISLLQFAPELLEVLEEILRFKSELRAVMSEKLITPDNFLKAIDGAEKVIARAKGESEATNG